MARLLSVRELEPVIVLWYALFVLTPTLVLVTPFFVWDELRNHRRRRAAALILGAVAVDAVAIGLGVYQATYITPASVEAE